MDNIDKSVSTRLSEEIQRLKKTRSFIADVCNVSTKTVERWCKNVPIPSDKLELLVSHGVDVLFVIYGVRFTSLERFATALTNKGGNLDDLIAEFYNDVEFFRSDYETDKNIDKKLEVSDISNTYDKSDRNDRIGSLDPVQDIKIGSQSARNNDEYLQIPVYDVSASAGNGRDITSEDIIDSLAFKQEWIHNELHVNPAHLYLIHVEGESMVPALHPGDVILIDHTDNTAKRDGVYVLRMDGALLVKRLQRLPGGIINVTSDNPVYQSFQIDVTSLEDGVAIIGRVVWTGRRL